MAPQGGAAGSRGAEDRYDARDHVGRQRRSPRRAGDQGARARGDAEGDSCPGRPRGRPRPKAADARRQAPREAAEEGAIKMALTTSDGHVP